MAAAASFALRKATSNSPLFSKLLKPLRSASAIPSISRSFTSDVQPTDIGNRDYVNVDVDRRSSSADRSVSPRPDFAPAILPDLIDPFSPTKTVGQLLNFMDQFMDSPFFGVGTPRGGGSGGVRRGWNAREDEKALYLSMEMPGLSKEDVKVSVEDGTLVIKGEGPKEGSEEERRRFFSRVELQRGLYNTEEIKAEMKNGVLKVVVPKLEEEERRDVVEVKVE